MPTAGEPVRSTSVGVQREEMHESLAQRVPDRLATEEPMEIRLHGPGEAPRPVAVTLRTPGHDFELAVGFLLAEGLLESRADVVTVGYCIGPDNRQQYNVVTVRCTTPVGERIAPRPFAATSACGLCGKATIDELETRCASLAGVGPQVDASVLYGLPAALRMQQTLFGATGGVHAAALANIDGTITIVREDIGRHNALDKVFGCALLDDALPLHEAVVLVSGRLGFELVQKAAVAGVTVIAAVGAPSSLAVSTARRLGVTTVAFVRADGCSVYTHPERVRSRESRSR
jgi:FdhD protein